MWNVMKVDFEVLTDVRKEEMFAICLNDTLVHLESLGEKKPKPTPSDNSVGRWTVSKTDAGAESRTTEHQQVWFWAWASKREQQVG